MTSRIDFFGHATTVLEVGGVRVLTDPLLRPRISALVHRAPHVFGSVPRSVDAIVISHLHQDHLDLASLKRFDPRTRILVPRHGRALVRRHGFSEVEEVEPGDRFQVGDVPVLVTRAVHLGLRAPFGPWGGCVGYVFEAPGRVYFAGDTQAFTEMQGLRPIDVVLVPIAGWGPVLGPGHMGPGAAIDALRLIRPRVAIPIHWGSLVPLGLHRRSWGYLTQPPLDFLELARQHMPEVQVQILQPGESFAF